MTLGLIPILEITRLRNRPDVINQSNYFRVLINAGMVTRNKSCYTEEHFIDVQELGGAHEWKTNAVRHMMHSYEVMVATERRLDIQRI